MCDVRGQHSQPPLCDRNIIWASTASALADQEPLLLPYFIPYALGGHLSNRYLLTIFEKIKWKLVCRPEQLCADMNSWESLRHLALLLHFNPLEHVMWSWQTSFGAHWGISGANQTYRVCEKLLWPAGAFSVSLWKDQLVEHIKITACKMDGFVLTMLLVKLHVSKPPKKQGMHLCFKNK